jgi:SAM-dependent methyltransferase
MDENNVKCILCGSEDITKYPSKCSAFLAERIWNKTSFDNSLIHCNTCDFTFYYPRPTEEELNTLYEGYRGTRYQEQRIKHEPGYTIEYNNNLGNNSRINNQRIRSMERFYEGIVNYNDITNLLDYGGADGQFISQKFKTPEKYVYDTSGVKLVDGIKRINSLMDTSIKTFDFIQCSNVLEHVADANEVMQNILKLSNRKTQFYFEVPYDTPFNSIRVQFSIHHPQLYNLYTKLTFNKPLTFLMHEHINHFSVESLTHLLKNHGLIIEKISIGKLPHPEIPVIYCLAKRNGMAD